MKNKAGSGEASMEEILASIRKIVAEEPAQPQPEVASPQAAMAAAPGPVDPQRTRADLEKDLDDLLGAGGPAEPAADAPTAESPASGNGTRKWFFNRSSATAAPAATPEPAASPQPGRLSETLELARANIRRATAAAGKSPLARLREKAEGSNGAEPSSDLGAVVPGRYDAGAGAPNGRALPVVTPQVDAKAASASATQPTVTPHVSLPAATAPQWGRVSNPLSPSSANGSANGHASRSLEDAVVELLRPMLRDWLDANMPRIMERVMRETSVGSKPKS